MKLDVKSIFTKFPHCLATYVCLGGMAWLLLFGWKPVLTQIPTYLVDDPRAAAIAEASRVGGVVSPVADTGSMRPALEGGDWVVSVKKWDEVKVGTPLIYTASYHAGMLVHRVAAIDKHGAIMSGDTAKRTESWGRVTEKEY